MSVNAEFIDSSDQKATDFSELWHPYVVLYIGHVAAAGAGTAMSLYIPKSLIVLMAMSGLVFVISAAADLPAWGYPPGSYIWIGVLIKWLIVNAFATVPVLILRAWTLTKKQVQAVGIFVYTILGLNVLWTLGLDGRGHVVVYVNRATAVMLTVSLVIHCLALWRHGQPLYEIRNGFPYGFGTTFPWLICYTMWNAMFIAKVSVGSTLQDFLFWAMMFVYQHWDWQTRKERQPIEFYFGFARPVQLGTYIAFAEWCGTLIPWFYEAPELKHHQPLPVNSHSYFFFIVLLNFFFSIFVTLKASYRLWKGLGSFVDRYHVNIHRHELEEKEQDNQGMKDAVVLELAETVGNKDSE